MITAILVDRLNARGAQTRLAEQLGVRVQTVNKWVQGQTTPEIDRWPAIEVALELAPGTFARETGIHATDTTAELPDGEDPTLAALNADPNLSEADRQYVIDLVRRLRTK